MELNIDKQFIDEAIQKTVEELKENNIWIPKGMTNGEVIQALFPNATFKDAFIDTFAEITFVGSGYALLKKEWWNAPYKAESEE